MPVIISAILASFITFATTSTINKHERVAFCEYAQKFSATQNDIMVSQRTGYDNLERIECAGEARIIRDNKNEVQNFTIFFPQKKYRVTVSDASSVTNVTFIRQ